MPFGLKMESERAAALQQAIQDELMARGYSPDPDPVMAEYITIMIINNKTPTQITAELEDLIGSDFDTSFTDWLFAEAAKGSSEPEPASLAEPTPLPTPATEHPASQDAHHATNDIPRRPPHASRGGAPLYRQAMNQAGQSAPLTGQKRTSSARSPSPGHPNKSRRTDLPTGPRAMHHRDGAQQPRSLLERVGGRQVNGPQRDDIQARIDNITNPPPDNMMMMNNGGMDMNPMLAAGMANPMLLQEMMMNQMAMMAQMAQMSGMGQIGFPIQGGDMGMMNGNGFQGHNGGGRGRGNGRGRGQWRGRGGPEGGHHMSEEGASQTVVAPTPLPAAASSGLVAPAAAPPAPTYALPERPQSPTLCKYGSKCTNVYCRWSHPSPVATAESGIVLSNDPCENGKNCKDKDCIKAHVSPAVLAPGATNQPPPKNYTTPAAEAAPTTPGQAPPPTTAPPTHAHPSTVRCRFGSACTKPGCTFAHPMDHTPTVNHFATQCKFGAGCTRATCAFQHPPSRVLPTTFHRGLSTTAPAVTIKAPETGSIGAASHHRSVVFNHQNGVAGVKEKLELLEAKKEEAKKAVREAEANAAANKKDEVRAALLSAPLVAA